MEIKSEADFATDAIYSIRKNPQATIGATYENLNWFENNTETKPTEKEFNDAVEAEKKKYTDNKYQRDRKAEYPPWIEQLDKIFHDGVAKWKSEMVQPVKDKYPKPE